MTRPRSAQVSLDDTPYYHCIARCVRRAFLCGEDTYSGQNFDHRRDWLVERIKWQARLFAIDICAYAIMSNHYHLVVRVDREGASTWSEQEVIERWCQVFRGPLLIQSYLAGEALGTAQRETVSDIVAVWRERLMNISWFMRCLNEFIARQANREDHCKGRFWEGRFKSQALLDTRALLSCMVYVDLNPIRAGIATDLPGSDFTSVRERLWQVAERDRQPQPGLEELPSPDPGLLGFSDESCEGVDQTCIPYRVRDYLELVDWTGRMVRADKRGWIAEPAPPVLQALQMDCAQWLDLSLGLQRRGLQVIGHPDRLQRYHQSTGRFWSVGQSALRKLYRSA